MAAVIPNDLVRKILTKVTAKSLVRFKCVSRNWLSMTREILAMGDLVWEILRRLPVKSLMRFKCVSRMWLSIITQPFFAQAYRRGDGGGSPAGLLSYYPPRRYHCDRRFFFNLDLKPSSGGYHVIDAHHVDSEDSKGITNVVDGLVCLYRGKQSWLYNVATRETVHLPDSPGADDGTCRYDFGYDSVNKRYKLVKTSNVERESVDILTIGVDPEWRTLDSFPPEKLTAQTQASCLGERFLCLLNNISNRLMVFDLAKEKFIENIPNPSEPIDPEDRYEPLPDWVLMNFGPDIAVTRVFTTTEPKEEKQFLRYDGGIWIDELPELHHNRNYDDDDAEDEEEVEVDDDVEDEEEEEEEEEDDEERLEPLDAVVLGIFPDGSGKIVMYDRSIGLCLFDSRSREWEKKMELRYTRGVIGEYGLRHIHQYDYIYRNLTYYQPNIVSLTPFVTPTTSAAV